MNRRDFLKATRATLVALMVPAHCTQEQIDQQIENARRGARSGQRPVNPFEQAKFQKS